VPMTTCNPFGQDALSACPRCGAMTPDIDGPTHPYMVSSPGCWRAFAELQADELTRFGYPPVHGWPSTPTPPLTAATPRSDAIASRCAFT